MKSTVESRDPKTFMYTESEQRDLKDFFCAALSGWMASAGDGPLDPLGAAEEIKKIASAAHFEYMNEIHRVAE